MGLHKVLTNTSSILPKQIRVTHQRWSQKLRIPDGVAGICEIPNRNIVGTGNGRIQGCRC